MAKKILGIGSIVSIAVMLWLVFYWAPTESAMGIVQKIMYIHVPTIWVAFLAFFLAFIFSIGYLWKRTENYDILACSAAEIGVVFCGLGLLSGAIWGKPTWNTYWSWDARLTSTLILFLIFMGYILLRKFVEYGEQQARFSAIVAIIGFLDIPLIHQSVVWWRTLHQPTTMFSKQKQVIDQPLFIMLWISVAAFSVLFAYIYATRIELEKTRRSYLEKVANLV